MRLRAARIHAPKANHKAIAHTAPEGTSGPAPSKIQNPE